MADKERWSWAWAQEKSNSVRSSWTSSTPQLRQMSKEETAQPAAVASQVDLNDLDSRSSDSRSPRRRISREASAGFVKIRRPAETPPTHEWTNLNAPTTAAGRISSWDSLVKIEAQRQNLLALARSAAPIDTVFRLSLLPRTVIPRLRMYKSFWFIMAVYGVSASLTRLGYEIEASLAREILDSGSSFVAFMIVFFVGYCYKRHEEQFNDVQHIMSSIANVCLMARANLEDQAEVYRLWRYVNAMHCTAYCGLTDHLTEANFFNPLSKKHGLLGSAKIREVESAAVRNIGIDDHGVRACSMFEVWAMEVIRAESNRCKVPAPIQAKLQDGVTEIGLTIQKLFATRYQVLPFIYTHLVSALSTIYLMVTAFLIGLYFEPGKPVVFLMCLSLIGLFVAILSTFGLLEVGSTILDPFGEDPEDFALTHFVEYAMGVSREAIDIQSCTIRGAHAEFYSPDEIAAAFKIFKSLVRRFRWRQIIAAARKARSLSSLPLGQTCQQMLPLSQPRSPPRPRQKPRSVRRDDAGRRCTAYGVMATQSTPNLSC